MKLLFLDLETTGTDPARHGIIQIAGVIVIDGEEKERIDIKVAPFPQDEIDPQALAINGVTKAELAGRLDPRKAYRKLIEILEKYIDRYDKSDKFFFVGYNAMFDNQFLRRWFEKNADKYFGSWFWVPPIDVMTIAAWKMMDQRASLENFKQATVAARLGVGIEGKLHDAMADILVTRGILAKVGG